MGILNRKIQPQVAPCVEVFSCWPGIQQRCLFWTVGKHAWYFSTSWIARGCIILCIPKYRGSSRVFEIAVVPAKESTLQAGSLNKLTHCLLGVFQDSIVSFPIRNIHNPLSITQHNRSPSFISISTNYTRNNGLPKPTPGHPGQARCRGLITRAMGHINCPQQAWGIPNQPPSNYNDPRVSAILR
jgi:hypothetical protein